MVLAALFFSFLLLRSARAIEDFQDINCSSYRPETDASNCLNAFRDPRYRPHFDKCKHNVCFLFIHEPPFVTYSENVFNAPQNIKQMQLPFLCRNPTRRHRSLGGIAFNVLRETSAGDEYCAWVGPQEMCTWNALVDFVAVSAQRESYQFAIVGPMLETPQRKCTHFASSSWWDGRMVVLGTNKRENLEKVHPIWQLIRPFQMETWFVVVSVVLLFVIVCLMIVYRFHVFRGKSLGTAVTAYFVFMGERTEALYYGQIGNTSLSEERHTPRLPASDKQRSNDLVSAPSSRTTFSDASASLQIDSNDRKLQHRNAQEKAFFTKFSLATSLFRISLVAFVAMFSLFYEVAVVNFLFHQQNLQITKDIEHLTLKELGRYAVVQDTAMEAVWNFRVNPRGTKFDDREKSQIPWKRCRNGTECFGWILDDKNPVQFYVTYEFGAMHLIQAEADCELVTIFETKGSIHHFNSGWLFNEQVPSEKRRQFDQELGALKIRGTLSDLVGGRPEFCSPKLISSISFAIILLPVAFLVLPPLLCSAAVALCWRRFNARKDNEPVPAHRGNDTVPVAL